MPLQMPAFSDLVELEVKDRKIRLVCTACNPPVVIKEDVKYANEVAVALREHQKEPK